LFTQALPGGFCARWVMGRYDAMALTLKQLGALAGVHASTVARVLNGDPDQRVSAEVRQRILKLAAEHHYQPNRIARSLRTKRSAVVGALIPDIANPFFALVFRGIEDALAKRDFTVILANTDDQPEREANGLAMMQGRQVDGLILATARRCDPAIEALAALGTPFVLVNRHTEPITPNVVAPDDFGGAVTAVEHLLSLGHRRIAHIAGSDAVSTGYARQAGYLTALQRHHVAHDPALLVEGNYRESGGYEAMRRLLQLESPPTAVFAVNDLAALGALRAMREAGVRSPEQVSIIGFNDLTIATQTSPQLTTMRLPLHEMGALAAERLLAQALGEQTPTEPIILPVSLIIRESVGPVPA